MYIYNIVNKVTIMEGLNSKEIIKDNRRFEAHRIEGASIG